MVNHPTYRRAAILSTRIIGLRYWTTKSAVHFSRANFVSKRDV